MQIDLNAARHNLGRVHELAPGCSVMAMVKANAYGHGLVTIAKALDRATAFGVASIDEGLLLRAAGITQEIILMEGLFAADELIEASKHNFTLVVHHLPQVEMLEQCQIDKPFRIWLKINTGMHRLGIAMDDFAAVYARLLRASAVEKPIGLMTHFAESDKVDGVVTRRQIDLFGKLTAGLPGPRSLANSAAIMGWSEAHGNWVRPGLMLYGASPFAGTLGSDYRLKPVMTMWSRLIGISSIKKGARVGYGSTWEAPQDMLLGVVGAGYGDGYPQFTRNGAAVLVNGVICEIAGRISMDMLTVDLRACPGAAIGDKVILWGEGLRVEKLAESANTSAYEILTRVTARPKVQVIGG
jgi:alanine racemase